jgi:hypothetical protein
MNERIKELLEQANELVRQDLEYSPAALLPQELVDEKFAELIVKECGVALSPMLRDMVSRGQAYNLIKQHFGVEE